MFEVLRIRGGHSEQFNFFQNSSTVRSNKEGRLNMVPMAHGWNSKRQVQETMEIQDTLNTHSHLFVKLQEKTQPKRAQYLVREE